MGEHNNAMCGYFSHAENYADFWNGVLFEGRREIKPQELEYSDKEYYSEKKNGKVNKRTELRRDVLAKRYKEKNEMLLGMEVMDTLDYTMPVRKLLYDAQEYHRQMKMMIQCNRDEAKEKTQQDRINGAQTKSKYWNNSGEFLYGFHRDNRIPPLITVVLYCGIEKYDGCTDLRDMLKLEQIETECREWIVGYPLHIITLQELNEEKFQTGLRELIGVMKRSSDKEALLEYYNDNRERFSGLDDLTIETIAIMIGNKQLIECKQEEGGLDMCKAFDDVRLEGKMEGRIEGKQEGICTSIRSLMKNLQMTAEQAMEALGIPQGEREMYLSRI